ncbi:MAG: nitrilase [Thermoprotei archaeon]|nr:MAG: nitrilase [Thermoprotei archaeon]
MSGEIVNILLNQINVYEEKEKNLEKVLGIIDKHDSDLIIFPEYTMGVPKGKLTKEYVWKNAEPLDGEFITRIIDKSEEKGDAIIFTAYLKEDLRVYNAAIFADRGRILGVYKKIHLFDAFGFRESEIFSHGSELTLSTYKQFKIGLAVCFDIRFPEIFRAMMYENVDIIIVPAAWYRGKYKILQWYSLALSRAHENNAYVIMVNQTGEKFTGHSLVASPLGYILLDLGEEEKSVSFELSSEEISISRKTLPMKQLSKRDLYISFYRKNPKS